MNDVDRQKAFTPLRTTFLLRSLDSDQLHSRSELDIYCTLLKFIISVHHTSISGSKQPQGEA